VLNSNSDKIFSTKAPLVAVPETIGATIKISLPAGVIGVFADLMLEVILGLGISIFYF